MNPLVMFANMLSMMPDEGIAEAVKDLSELEAQAAAFQLKRITDQLEAHVA